MTYDPTRPFWDKGTPGEPSTLADREDHRKALSQQEVIAAMSPEERLNYIDSIQSEATSLANSAGAAYMIDEQKLLASWLVNARVAAASLNTFRNPNNLVENREKRCLEQQEALAVALYKLGQIDEALSIATAAPFPDLVTHITWIKAAIDHEDDLTHDCPRGTAPIEIGGRETTAILDRRVEAELVFSARHAHLVHVWVCTVCGETNATIETPERQARQTPNLHRTINEAFQKREPLNRFQQLITEE